MAFEPVSSSVLFVSHGSGPVVSDLPPYISAIPMLYLIHTQNKFFSVFTVRMSHESKAQAMALRIVAGFPKSSEKPGEPQVRPGIFTGGKYIQLRSEGATKAEAPIGFGKL